MLFHDASVLQVSGLTPRRRISDKEAQQRVSAGKNRRRKILLGLSSAVAVLGVMEVSATLWLGKAFQRGMRVGTNWGVVGQKETTLGWANRPGARGSVANALFAYDVAINTLGFRDPEREVQKPHGKQRVLVIGDSVAWGWGVQNNERFSELLEARLGSQVEVVNMAVPGYGTDQSLWSLEQSGWNFEPDVVLYCFVLNDVLEASLDSYAGMPKPMFVRGTDERWSVKRPKELGAPCSLRDGLKESSAWLRANSALIASCSPPRVELDPLQQPDQIYYHAAMPDQIAMVQHVVDRLGQSDDPVHYALEQMANTCNRHGVPLVVTSVAFGHDQHLYEPRFPQPEGIVAEGYQASLSLAIEHLASELGYTPLSVDAAMLEAVSRGERLHCGDGHPNARGHAVLAEAMETPLLRVLHAVQGRKQGTEWAALARAAK